MFNWRMADLTLTLLTVLGIATVGWLGWKVAGPMAGPELRRWTNRKPPYRNRLLIAGGLLGLLALVYQGQFSGGRVTSLPAQARFAEQCFIVIFAVELIAVAVFTPVAVAPAISVDKESRSVELLWVTPLSAREILFGKLAARMTPVFDLILASVPLVAVLQFFGGVAFSQVALGFATVLITALAYAALAAGFAAETSTPRVALVATYGTMACCCTPPVGFMAGSFAEYADGGDAEDLGTWALAAVITLGFATMMLLSAWASVGPPIIERRAPELARPQLPPVAPSTVPPPPATYSRPPIGEHPLFWKEQYGDRGTGTDMVLGISLGFLLFVGFAALITATMAVVVLFSRGVWDPEPFALVEMVTTPLLTIAAVIAVGIGTALSVIAERERRTLTVLLTIPKPRSAILSAKLWGNLWRVRYFVVTLAMLWLIGLAFGVIGPEDFLGDLLLTAALLDAIGRIGVTISVVMRNATSALLLLAIILAVGGGCMIGCVVARGAGGMLIGALVVWFAGRSAWLLGVSEFEREEPT